jgi:hypothetical protein
MNGVALELGQELARRIGVPFEPVVTHQSNPWRKPVLVRFLSVYKKRQAPSTSIQGNPRGLVLLAFDGVFSFSYDRLLNGIQEVEGSIPFGSTKIKYLREIEILFARVLIYSPLMLLPLSSRAVIPSASII